MKKFKVIYRNGDICFIRANSKREINKDHLSIEKLTGIKIAKIVAL